MKRSGKEPANFFIPFVNTVLFVDILKFICVIFGANVFKNGVVLLLIVEYSRAKFINIIA